MFLNSSGFDFTWYSGSIELLVEIAVSYCWDFCNPNSEAILTCNTCEVHLISRSLVFVLQLGAMFPSFTVPMSIVKNSGIILDLSRDNGACSFWNHKLHDVLCSFQILWEIV